MVRISEFIRLGLTPGLLNQKELRGVRVGTDFVRTLAVVRQIIQELPDHPKMGDVARVVERLNARLK